MEVNKKIPIISAFMAMSLDGFIATKEHGIAWLDMVDTENEDYGIAEFMKTIDAMVVGRNTYDVVRSFNEWPYQDKKVVILTHRPFTPIKNEIAESGPLIPIFTKLAESGVKRVYIEGGITIQNAIREKVINDLTLAIIPILLGGGIPLFGEMNSHLPLKLLTSKQFSSGLVQLHYDFNFN